MLLGYNTNGFAHHDPLEAVGVLADIGYESVALTLDHGPLNPFDERCGAAVAELCGLLTRRGMRSVVETGARFLLDAWEKHEPTLLSPEPARRRRIDFYKRAIDVAAELQSDCVSLWSGVLRPDPSGGVPDDDVAWDRLTTGLQETLEYARERRVAIGFEPEPGMFIDTMDRFEQLLSRLDDPHLRLTLDVGHLHCQGETPIGDRIRRWADRLVNVHIEDMRQGVHEHLMFGEGEMDFPPILAALAEAGYQGGVHVELSRHSHMAPAAARQAYAFLRRAQQAATD